VSAGVLVFLVCVIACIVAHSAILLSVVRNRAAAIEPGVPRPRRIVEIVWALIPALALAFVLTATWGRVASTRVPKPDLMMKIAQ
jgi:heme/copper-type cytochrome/quinol oxidase subunit 2